MDTKKLNRNLNRSRELSSTPQPKRRSKRLSGRKDEGDDHELTASEADGTEAEGDADAMVDDDARSVDSMLNEYDEASGSDSDV